MKRVFIIAGESSGDLHGSALINRIKAHRDDVIFKGIGGSNMVAEGLDSVRRLHEMNFMGFAEVVKHLPFIRHTLKECESLLDSWHPDLVILIDYPGFNLRFASLVKKRGIPVMYYVSPQLWAWHKSRVTHIRKNVDRMVVLFGFEKHFYNRYGIDADFVGHPLIDIVKPSEEREIFRKKCGASDSVPLIGFLPGSRIQEIERMLPAMTESIPLISDRIGSFVPVLGCAPEIDESVYRSYIEGTGIIPFTGKTYDIMAHSDAVAVTSGTATLEAGILGTPMIIVYKTSFLTYLIGRTMVDIDNIGLINIVAGSRIVPELWQNNVTPQNIATLLGSLIADREVNSQVKKELSLAKLKLGETGASERAAAVVLEMLND